MSKLEILKCDICGRKGTTGYRVGSKPGADICTSRKACSRRQRQAAAAPRGRTA